MYPWTSAELLSPSGVSPASKSRTFSSTLNSIRPDRCGSLPTGTGVLSTKSVMKPWKGSSVAALCALLPSTSATCLRRPPFFPSPSAADTLLRAQSVLSTSRRDCDETCIFAGSWICGNFLGFPDTTRSASRFYFELDCLQTAHRSL